MCSDYCAQSMAPGPGLQYDAWQDTRKSILLLFAVMVAWLLPLYIINWAYAAYQRVKGRPRDLSGDGASSERPMRREGASDGAPEFRFAVSKFDTHGNLITIWQPAPPLRLESADFGGFLGMFICAGIFWVVSNGLYNLKHSGAWWPDGGAWLVHTFHRVGSLAWQLGCLWLLYGLVAYPLVVAFAIGALQCSGRGCIALQYLGEAVLLIAPCLYLRTRLDWPWTQRLFYAIETGILVFKASNK